MLRTISNYLSLLVAAALAFSVPVAGAANSDYASAQVYVRTLVADLVAEVTEHRDVYVNDEQRLYDLIEEKIVPSIDTSSIARLALGKHWKTTSAEQQKVFTASLQTMLTNLYGKSLIILAEVDSVRFPAPEKAKAGKGKYQMVVSRFVFKGGKTPLEVKYVVKPNGARWQIFDMVIDGNSILKQLRQSFEREIAEASVDALITRISATQD